MIEELKSKLRPVEEDDRKNLITVSYSKLSLKDQCDLRYELKYNEGNYSNSGSMATGVGSILHKALELKGRSIMANEQIDYKQLESVVYEGCEEVTDKGSEKIPGINDIIAEYFTDWFAVDPNTDMDMNTKLKLFFDEVLPERMEDKAWNILGTEISFEFVYDNRCIIHGFIDRVDEKTDNPEVLKVVDYKSSKKTFRDTDIKTPLQMVVYDLACVQLFGKIPQFHEYDFILLNQKQTGDDGVCSKGYLKRGLKKLDRILNSIDMCNTTRIFKPSPTPLCYWCEFAGADYSPNTDPKFAGLCPYHSLWTPDNKTFKKNMEWIPEPVTS